MKVLEKGNPNGWEIEQHCTGKDNGDGGCGAKLLVSEGDIKCNRIESSNGKIYWFTFKCPECGVETDIPEKENSNFKENQIIIFTCSNREKEALNKMGIEYNYIEL